MIVKNTEINPADKKISSFNKKCFFKDSICVLFIELNFIWKTFDFIHVKIKFTAVRYTWN